MRRNSPARQRRPARGIVLLALLITMALGSVAAMAALESWATVRQREDEQELIFIGQQFQAALLSYYLRSPGQAKALPSTLEQLLEDDRFPMPVRHLRRIYTDPMTGTAEWGLVREGNRIKGVYSTSRREPIKKTNFSTKLATLENKASYDQWQFIVELPKPNAGPQRPVPPGSKR